MDNFGVIKKILRDGKRFLVASHYNPDGDAIGSTSALGLLLKRMGKKYILYNRDYVPQNLRFLPLTSEYKTKLNKDDRFDVTILVDASEPKRISDEIANFGNKGRLVCIDHHASDNCEIEACIIDGAAASAGELLYRLLNFLKEPIDSKIAECLYTTLVIDTGFFKYSCTNAKVMKIASEFLDAGANPWLVAKNLEESYPASRLKLLGATLGSIETHCNGKYATMDVTQKMLRDAGATMEQTEEFATYPRSIAGVEVSAFFREHEDGKTKVSLRSKDYVDVSAIAKQFGGGGHNRAAGFQIKGTIEEAKGLVLEEVKHKIGTK